MSGVPRFFRSVLVVLSCAAVFSCATMDQKPTGHPRPRLAVDPDTSVCFAETGKPVPNPSTKEVPIVCIDDRDMSQPLTVNLKRVVAMHNTVINWMTVTRTGSIMIIFDSASPVSYIRCGQGKGFCQTSMIDTAVASGDYPYTAIVVSGGRKQTVDPTVQVDPGFVQIQIEP